MKSSIAMHMKNFYKVSLGLRFVVLIMSISISSRESYPVMKKKKDKRVVCVHYLKTAKMNTVPGK